METGEQPLRVQDEQMRQVASGGQVENDNYGTCGSGNVTGWKGRGTERM